MQIWAGILNDTRVEKILLLQHIACTKILLFLHVENTYL